MRDFDEDDGLLQPEASGPGTVTVNPTVIEYSSREMFASIARAAAANIIEQCKRDLRQEVANLVKESITSQVAAIVTEVLDGKIQLTNEFGEPKGEVLSLREMAARSAQNYLGVMVDKDGRASSYQANQSRLQYLVTKTVGEVFNYQMQAEVKKAVEQARAEAVGRVGRVVADMVIKLGVA